MSQLQNYDKTLAQAINKRIERAANTAPRNAEDAQRKNERVVNWLSCIAHL